MINTGFLTNELIVRLGFFLGVFTLMACWEIVAERRSLTTSKHTRWFSNLTITVVNAFLLRWITPVLPVGMALVAQERTWGLLNRIDLPSGVAVVLAVAVLDLAIYLQHMLFHAVPFLWRFHMVHHADLDFDVTTGLRFHPIEMILSMGIKLGIVVLLGPPVLAVLIFEVLLNTTAMFNHSNVWINTTLDRYLRRLVVTPDMHRVHHSVVPKETNSNFGFNFPWWDRLFGTYHDQPTGGHDGMNIGLHQFRDAKRLNLHQLLVLPFVHGRTPPEGKSKDKV